jgi:hypothetical protein
VLDGGWSSSWSRWGLVAQTLARKAANDHLNKLVSQSDFLSELVRRGYGIGASG